MDEKLTTATMRNIITGKKNVSKKKTISYLCQKLDWEWEKIPQYAYIGLPLPIRLI
ncbi:hypothetical protein EDD57_10342 [Baia soyae]|uniref:Uncharacterized protein n=1 Tax=Baia soyae TaxID=1544746 RepID=A0A4R2RZ86_9BACL|nr:hypothetical protein EDD57_10342 [Baia soyae]